MISNPKHGWCCFQIENFQGTPSYITDVPVDLLQAFIDYHEKGSGISWFDEEGSNFSLVLTPYSIFIITETDRPTLLNDFSRISIHELEKELVSDIESNIGSWASFSCDINSDDEFQQESIKIIDLIDKLKDICGL